MWPYKEITRKEFEKIKDKIEQFIIELGGKIIDIQLPYKQMTKSNSSGIVVTNVSLRPIFEMNNEYFRVDEICFEDKPYIVIEFGSYQDLLNNSMEDADPFPYDLSQQDMKNEVRYLLGLEVE